MKLEKTSCNICGVENSQFIVKAKSLYSDDFFSLVRCNACDLVYVNPRQVMAEKKLSDVDNVAYFEKTRSRDDCIYKRVLEKIEKAASHKGKLLDIGCAIGSLLIKARHHGWDVTGVEINRSCSEYARNTLNLNVICGELKDAHFLDKSFDVVSMVHVIEHIYDPRSLIFEAGRVLKAGGIIYIETPNFNNYFVRAAKRLGFKKKIDDIDPTGHPYMFTRNSLTRLMISCGFKVVSIEDGLAFLAVQKNGKKHRNIFKIARRVCSWIGGGSSLICVARKV